MNQYPNSLPKITNQYPKSANDGLLWLCRAITPELKARIDKTIPNKSFLGSGSVGVAYLCNNLVVKLTSSKREKEAADLLLEKQLPCVVTVFSSETIADGIHKIVLEKAEPISELLGKVFTGSWYYFFLKNESTEVILARLEYLKENKAAILKELRKIELLKEQALASPFSFGDLRKENIGMRQDRIVVLDVGCCKQK